MAKEKRKSNDKKKKISPERTDSESEVDAALNDGSDSSEVDNAANTNSPFAMTDSTKELWCQSPDTIKVKITNKILGVNKRKLPRKEFKFFI